MRAPSPQADAMGAGSIPAASSTPDHLPLAAHPHLSLCQYKPSCFPGWCENDGEIDPGTDPAENIPFFF